MNVKMTMYQLVILQFIIQYEFLLQVEQVNTVHNKHYSRMNKEYVKQSVRFKLNLITSENVTKLSIENDTFTKINKQKGCEKYLSNNQGLLKFTKSSVKCYYMTQNPCHATGVVYSTSVVVKFRTFCSRNTKVTSTCTKISTFILIHWMI